LEYKKVNKRLGIICELIERIIGIDILLIQYLEKSFVSYKVLKRITVTMILYHYRISSIVIGVAERRL